MEMTTSLRRGALSKKSRRTETSPGVVELSVDDVRLAMPLQGNSVWTDRRHNLRNEEGSPLKSLDASTGLG